MAKELGFLVPSGQQQTRSTMTRPLTLADAEAVFELTRAAEVADSGRAMVELDDIRSDWARPSFDISAQTIGYFTGEELTAYGEVHRARAEAYVHPGQRGRGLGSDLFEWTVGKARELGYERIGQTVPLTNTAALALFAGFGCHRLWTSWVLELPGDATIADTALPPGHRMREFDPDRDARDVFQTLEDAFNEWPNREPSTFEDWAAWSLGRSDFEPWQITVVMQDIDGTEQVVGAAKVSSSDDEAWIDQIAVRRDARGRGLGRALLVRAFAVARTHGATTLRLNTDSRTGALGLYEHVGMTVVETYEHHALTLA